jgi:DNA repair protein RadD
MTWTPRPYQQEAIDATFDYWAEIGGNPLIVIPTGGGKAGILGTIMRRLFDQWSGIRILNLAMVAELVDQNYKETLGFWDWAPAGVYSAGLNRRDAHAQILFASIQSVWNKAHLIGHCDLIIIDEAHTVPKKVATMFGKFIAAMRKINPEIRLLGLTATDYRLDSGRLTEGDDKLFDDVAYEVGLRELIEDGYLTPLTSKATQTALSTKGVKKTGGDFNAKALQAAVDKEELNAGIVDDIISYGQDRRSWLVFASGVEHAQHLCDEIRSRGFSADVLTGDTEHGARKRMIEDFKAYRLRALVNCGVLTTGFNHPGVDLIAAARPTESAGLYVQIAGRGTRNVYAPGYDLSTREGRLAAIANGPKPNCLFLDFGGLVRRHGPVDMVTPKKPGKGGGDAPVKTCPECFSLVHASVMECPDCGHEWERQLSTKITKSAAVTPILSKSESIWRKVDERRFSRHEKFGAAPSMKVEYKCGPAIFPEWIAFENEKARGIAERWWRKCGGAEPVPATTAEALKRTAELRKIEEVRIQASGKFWRVTGERFGGDAVDEVVADAPPPAARGNLAFGLSGGFR